ncbi:ankyrin repeat domain-containing protein [Geothrix sp. PMB-07]|uniref:ankyrin repeat domain-containing protein n=1 Tax=Geothrix sp. PMB-07 TaxID=3068640 RepID=UPI002740E631|nr:ankyrin repeat domain-containing protein [Geothrix sp. PMB-07]WLT31983.1 ankyrin repeat domain-containing protein [Geothrix sp. PMB-07]
MPLRCLAIAGLVTSFPFAWAQPARPADAELFAALAKRDAAQLQALLAKGGNPDAKDAKGVSLVWMAVLTGQPQALEQVLAAGSHGRDEVNPLDPRHPWTPLRMAAVRSDAACMRVLLGHGARVGEVSEGLSLLAALATIPPKPETSACVNLLLEAGADIGWRDALGMTALHYAARKSNAEVTGVLLAGHLDPDARSYTGLTPLMMAVGSGREDLVDLLLQRGASPHPITGDGQGILSVAAAVVPDPAVKARLLARLRAGGAPEGDQNRPVDSQFLDAVAKGDVAMAEQLLGRGADLWARRAGTFGLGHDALTEAVRHPAMLKFLLGRNLPARLAGHNGFTPLHTAAYLGDVESVRLLVAAGADVNAVSAFGTTPLTRAVDRNPKDAAAMVTLLLSLGADPARHRTADRESLVDYARRKGRTELVTLLQPVATR